MPWVQTHKQQTKPQNVRGNDSRIYAVFCKRNAIEAIYGGPMRVLDALVGSAAERDSTGRFEQKGNYYICSKCRTTRKAYTLCNEPVCAEHSTDKPQRHRY